MNGDNSSDASIYIYIYANLDISERMLIHACVYISIELSPVDITSNICIYITSITSITIDRSIQDVHIDRTRSC